MEGLLREDAGNRLNAMPGLDDALSISSQKSGSAYENGRGNLCRLFGS